jgi:hypothetical protein
MSHSTKYNILSSEQYTFRKNLTTDNATYTLTNKILTAMNNKSKARGILCDVENTSDCVNHNHNQKLNLYIKKGTKPKLQITGQFHYSLYFLKSLKKFYIKDYKIIYFQTIY